jgi:UrcA family protein
MTQVTHRFNAARLLVLTLSALTASLAVAGAVQAAPADTARSVAVSYRDLNLTSDEGTQVLYARIVSAARAVCAVKEVDIRDLHSLTMARACESKAIANAVAAVNNPRLAALHGTRTERG